MASKHPVNSSKQDFVTPLHDERRHPHMLPSHAGNDEQVPVPLDGLRHAVLSGQPKLLSHQSAPSAWYVHRVCGFVSSTDVSVMGASDASRVLLSMQDVKRTSA